MFIDKYAWCKEIIERGHHTLVAGCSGSGKSVAIHDLLYTLMLDSPENNCFVLIDTKKVELVDFKDAPHTVKYVDDPDEVYPLLKKVMDIMDRRFERMQARHEKKSSEPTLWVVIDEYFDIMTLCDKKVMPILNRLSSAGRAAKVLLLVGTQRTTRDVLSGMIATNFSCKLGLRTITKQDSRNIIQVSGCENLPKYGKGILQIDGINEEIEIPYTSEEKIEERVQYWIDWWNSQQVPTPNHTPTVQPEPKKRRFWQRKRPSTK